MAQRIEEADRVDGGHGEFFQSGGGQVFTPGRQRETIWAKITSGTNPYAWSEAIKRIGSNVWDTPTGLRSGTTSVQPLYESAGSGGSRTGEIVEATWNPQDGTWSFRGRTAAVFSGARVYKSFAQSIPDTTETAIDFSGGVTAYDTDSYNSISDRFTPPVFAWYRFGGYVSFAANTTGIRHLRLLSSGGTGYSMSLVPPATGGFPTRLAVADEAALGDAGNTWIKLMVQQTSGGPLDCIAWGFFISKIG